MHPHLPVLDNLHVAAPCKASWADMTGDDRTRFCGSCEKNVYNLSAMTRADAAALLIEKEGKLCVRYYQRADGTIITADCPDGIRRRNRKRRIVAAAFGAMTAMAAATFVRAPLAMQGEPVPTEPTQVAPEPTVTEPEPIKVIGELAALPPPPVEVKGKISTAMPTMGSVSVIREPLPPKAHKKH